MQRVLRVFRGTEEEIAWDEVCAECRAAGAPDCRHVAPVNIIVGRDRVVTRFVGGDKLPLLPSQLPMLDGSWAWLRQCNEDLHRATRLDASELLQTAIKRGGYAFRQGGRTQTVKFKKIKEMKAGTQVVSDEKGLPTLPTCPYHPTMLDYCHGGHPVEKAMDLCREGLSVAIVSAASGYHAGGGFATGGRHALEEAMCTQSTLYGSLEKVEKDMADRGQSYRIPEGGVIVSPSVEFFRNGTDQGYPIYSEPREVAAVVSLAMYNKNPRVRDSAVDAPADEAEYAQGVARKFEAMAHGAVLAGANALVLPDVGCGVFGNEAAVVGAIAGRALRDFIGYFKCIAFTGNQQFHNAAMRTIAELTIGRRPQPQTPELLPSTRCVVCGQLLGKDLAVLIGPSGERAMDKFLHEYCTELLEKNYQGFTAMSLPAAAETPEDFLRALADGNGWISKVELRCVIAALMGGDPDVAQFDARWKEWDYDGSGYLDLSELQRMAASPETTGGQAQRRNGGLPPSLLEWVRAQALREPAAQANPAMAMPA